MERKTEISEGQGCLSGRSPKMAARQVSSKFSLAVEALVQVFVTY